MNENIERKKERKKERIVFKKRKKERKKEKVFKMFEE